MSFFFAALATAAGGLMLAAALLILPVALFVRSLAPLVVVLLAALAPAVWLLAGNYFQPWIGFVALIGVGLAVRNGRLRALARVDVPQSPGRSIFPAGVPIPPGASRTGTGRNLSDARGAFAAALSIAPILVCLIGGWLFLFLPELIRVAPILPADSPADVLSFQRIVRDFQTNYAAPFFAAPWLAVLLLAVLGGRRREKLDLDRQDA
ncbi:MAG: hypothetical protein RIF32_16530 [Leptospirales bacterium]|jgi:hypothetical protein